MSSLVRYVSVAAIAALSSSASSQAPGKAIAAPAVTITADHTVIAEADSLGFTVHIRADLAATMRHVDSPGSPVEFTPHLIGWRWIPDMDAIDTSTSARACKPQELRCTLIVLAGGTMAYSIRTASQLCVAWIHIDMRELPDIDERDPRKRLHADSVSMAIKTKAPFWRPC